MFHFFHRVDWENKVAKTKSVESLTNSSAQSIETVEQKRRMYLIVYVSLIIFGTVCIMCCSAFFFLMCVRISINLHEMIFRGVSRAKMIFFNNNPSGRILNRFAGDISNVDSMLPEVLFHVLDVSLKIINYSNETNWLFHVLLLSVYLELSGNHNNHSICQSVVVDSGFHNDIAVLSFPYCVHQIRAMLQTDRSAQ